VGITPWARLTLQVNNLLDADRVYPSGYTYRFFSNDVPLGTAYYYPQAGRNAVVLMDFDL
jgi:outer membrane receptor protein involved in Fe transport